MDDARYRASITYASNAPISRVDGAFDIAVDGTAIAGINIDGTAGRTAATHIDFDGTSGDFEFRTQWAGNAAITVESVTITRIGE